MITKNEDNYFLDIALFIIGFVSITTGILMHLKPQSILSILSIAYIRPLHIWIGYTMAAIIITHLLMHAGWIATVTKNIFKDKKKVLFLAIVIVISVVSCYLVATLTPKPQFPKGTNQRGAPYTIRDGMHNQLQDPS